MLYHYQGRMKKETNGVLGKKFHEKSIISMIFLLCFNLQIINHS
jgi:hypothetical protein